MVDKRMNVFEWPEFIALCRRLKAANDRPTRYFRLTLQMDDPPLIEQEYFGEDAKENNDA